MDMQHEIIELLQNYGYFGIYLFLVVGIAGLPLPDEIMMTFLGYLTSIEQLNLFWTYMSALLGSASGITISYILGLKLGYPFIKRYGSKIHITERRLRITQYLFRKYGSGLLFIGYFIPGVRHVTAYIAGISKMSAPRFFFFAYTGAIVWCATFIGLGHQLGENWEMVNVLLHRYGVYLLALVICFLIVWFFWNKKNRKPLR